MALPNPSRGALAAKVRAAGRRAALLAEAPVPAGRVDPIVIDAPASRIHCQPIRCNPPPHRAVGCVPGETARHGNVINDEAAMRAYLAGAHEWGPQIRVAVRLADGCEHILIGSFGAIARILPDTMTLDTWRAAGAVEMSALELGEKVRGRRVPLSKAPIVAQLERASRGGN